MVPIVHELFDDQILHFDVRPRRALALGVQACFGLTGCCRLRASSKPSPRTGRTSAAAFLHFASCLCFLQRMGGIICLSLQ